MRELTFNEMSDVSGGLTGIEAGLRCAGVDGACILAWDIGWAIGTWINDNYIS
jgi:hypothetical protein